MSKDPVTDPGKKSKEGLLSVETREDGSYAVVVAETLEAYAKNLEKSEMVTYYADGRLTRFDSLHEMRSRAAKGETHWIGKNNVVVVDNERKRKSPSGSCRTPFRAERTEAGEGVELGKGACGTFKCKFE